MPNYCQYTMYAEGKSESIDELVVRLTTVKGERPHFFRVFEANVEDLVPRSDGTRLVCITGNCAWSVGLCMTEPEVAPHCTSLEKTSDDLGIEIEVFSEEPMMEFAEHYHYVPNGQTVEEDCEFKEVWWDRDEYETFTELDKAYGLTAQGITEKDFDDEDCVAIGGFLDLEPFCYQKTDGDVFDVELTAPGPNRISVAKAIRTITGCSLKEASDTARRTTPKVIIRGATKEDAEAAKRALEEAGATVTLK